jgi:hypothetical protein
VLPRPARHQVALLAAVALLVGCAGDEGAPGGAASDEIEWLERLSRWERETDEAAEESFSMYSAVLAGERRPEALAESFRPIRRCSRRLREEVGEPPRRYAKGFGLMLKACSRYEEYASELERSFEGDPGNALLASQTAGEEADRLVLLARRAIENRLTANRRLPRLGGKTGRSRIEPRFSRVASVLVGRPVEVICWSREEWPKARSEWGAYLGATDIGAFADYNADRAYLSPEYCEGIVDLVYRKRRPTSGIAHEKIADGVLTLAHEAEHLVAAAAGEAETECYAMQDIRRVAMLLGASPRYAAGLAEVYWEELYEAQPDYVSRECHDGGPWDRNDSSNEWP